MTQLLSLLGIIVSGFVGFFFGRRQDIARDAARRPIIASAILAELQSLEIGLRRLAKHTQAAHSTIYPDSSTFQTLKGDLVLFEATTAQNLLVFYGLIEEINSSRGRMRDEGAEPGERAHDFVRVKATFAANRLADLRNRLVAAGGSVLPAELVVWAPDRATIQLDEPAFESTKKVPST